MAFWSWLWFAALALYLVCSLWFLLCNLIQLHLLWKSSRARKNLNPNHSGQILPFVTIQVPVYNERYVVARILTALSRLDYPKDLLEIQILDDSTDDTSAIIDDSVATLFNRGISATIIRRISRKGYKAGALQAGLQQCRGSVIAIFDADFTPADDFLLQMVPYFNDPKVGGVQSRWTHRNLYQNWLTIIQSYLLDSHFTLEQQGRQSAGYFVNFNGTAGIWRKQCIIDSGGWNGEVLTEDLELSYRAQLKGWKFVFDKTVEVPADLPAETEAFKTQQFRWAKGMAQSAACHLKAVLRMKLSFGKKVHAVFHLMSSVSFVAVFGNMLLALPILAGRHYSDEFAGHSEMLFFTAITLPLICIYYNAGTKINLTRKEFWYYLPVFLVVYMALSVQNSIAVIQGVAGIKSPFLRTPKPGDQDSPANTYKKGIYSSGNTLIELLVFVYLTFTVTLSVVWKDYFLLSFLIMAWMGLLILLRPVFMRYWQHIKTSPAFLNPRN